jgi:hypothetical protein
MLLRNRDDIVATDMIIKKFERNSIDGAEKRKEMHRIYEDILRLYFFRWNMTDKYVIHAEEKALLRQLQGSSYVLYLFSHKEWKNPAEKSLILKTKFCYYLVDWMESRLYILPYFQEMNLASTTTSTATLGTGNTAPEAAFLSTATASALGETAEVSTETKTSTGSNTTPASAGHMELSTPPRKVITPEEIIREEKKLVEVKQHAVEWRNVATRVYDAFVSCRKIYSIPKKLQKQFSDYFETTKRKKIYAARAAATYIRLVEETNSLPDNDQSLNNNNTY